MELYNDLDKRREFGKNAMKNIELFLHGKVLPKWEAFFNPLTWFQKSSIIVGLVVIHILN